MKYLMIIVLGLALVGCDSSDAPDERVTIKTVYSDGTTSTDTYDYYYSKENEELNGLKDEDGFYVTAEGTPDVK